MAAQYQQMNDFLLGKGRGKRIEMAGVIYPDEVTAPAKPRLTRRPSWGISTADAARMLGVTPAAARMLLEHRKIRHVKVWEQGQVPRLFWDSRRLPEILDSAAPRLDAMPRGYISAADACRLLHCSRSTLTRYEGNGLLQGRRVRLLQGSQYFVAHIYHARTVAALAGKLLDIHCRERDLQRMRAELRRSPAAKARRARLLPVPEEGSAA